MPSPGDIVASLVCIAMPAGTCITGLDDEQRIPLRRGSMVRIGGRKAVEVVVRGPNIVVSQASLVVIQIDDAGTCRVRDSGHNFEVCVNDEAHPVSAPRALDDGDLIEPYLFGEPLGLRFRFQRQAATTDQ
jgi:hypothetical protein